MIPKDSSVQPSAGILCVRLHPSRIYPVSDAPAAFAEIAREHQRMVSASRIIFCTIARWRKRLRRRSFCATSTRPGWIGRARGLPAAVRPVIVASTTRAISGCAPGLPESVPEPAAVDAPATPYRAPPAPVGRLFTAEAAHGGRPATRRIWSPRRFRALRVPVGTVKSQLQRSLAILREKVARTMGMVNL
jgi:hypothetical protein